MHIPLGILPRLNLEENFPYQIRVELERVRSPMGPDLSTGRQFVFRYNQGLLTSIVHPNEDSEGRAEPRCSIVYEDVTLRVLSEGVVDPNTGTRLQPANPTDVAFAGGDFWSVDGQARDRQTLYIRRAQN